jgi:outer membrane protein
MRRLLTTTAVFCLPGIAFAQQTPLVHPHTVDSPVPPPVTVPGPAVPADIPNRPLTADEAAQIALRRQPSIEEARAAVLAAEGRTQQARAALGPSVPVSATYSYAATRLGSGGYLYNSAGGEYSASVRQLIFDFSHTRDLVRQAVALTRASQFDLTRAQSDLVLSVKSAFYTYVEDVRLVKVAEDDLKNRQSQLDLANARFNTGIGLPSDVATAQTAVAQSVLSLNVARNTADLARVNLALLLGIDPRTPIQVADTNEPTFPNNDVNALVNTALKLRPEILEALANLKATHYAVNAARTTNAPSITGNATLGASSGSPTPGTEGSAFSVGVAIQFTPFDSGLTAGLVKTARANATSAQAALLAEQLQVKSDVAQAYFSLRTSEQRISIAAIEVQNANEEVRIAEGRYRNGLGLFQDIITADAALVTANTDRVTTQFSVDLGRANINHALGNPVPSTPTLK